LAQQNIADRRRKAKAQYDKRASAPLREFSKGEKVYVKPRPTNRQQPWIFGEVIGKPAPRACLVNTQMEPVRRNHAQIREAKVEPPDSCDRFETASIPSESGPTEQMDQTTPTTLVESDMRCNAVMDFVCFRLFFVCFEKGKGVTRCSNHIHSHLIM